MKNLMRTKALWFISRERERTVNNWRDGTIGKEQAIGSINMLYQIAAEIDDAEAMRELCRLTAKIRSADHRLGPLDPAGFPQRIG